MVPFVQFKKHEKHPWRSATFRGFSLQIYQHFSMGVFHIFKIVQMQPNWTTHHSYLALFMDTMNAREKTVKTCKKFVLRINAWDVYYVSIFSRLYFQQHKN